MSSLINKLHIKVKSGVGICITRLCQYNVMEGGEIEIISGGGGDERRDGGHSNKEDDKENKESQEDGKDLDHEPTI